MKYSREALRKRRKKRVSKVKKKKLDIENRKTISVANSSDFRFIESYKLLRTNLTFSLSVTDECRKVLFTSSSSFEGKTTTAVNLAITLSETGDKVLLIDADMRKPMIHKYFNLESRKGLSNLISGMCGVEESVQKVKDYPNLSIITAGAIPPNPSELLGSESMRSLLERFEKQYNYIIIDTPPINVVSDTLSIVNEVDGVAFVIRCGRSTYPEVTRALETLKFANANILGAIINDDENGSRGYYDSYSYKYYRSTKI